MSRSEPRITQHPRRSSAAVPPVHITGDGSPVVLVDGASPPAWGDLVDRIATHHRVLTYVRRGFSPQQDLPLARRLREHTNDLAAILADHRPVTVVGWSSGGTIALDLALQRPDLVHRLVVLEPPLHARHHPDPGMLRAVLTARLVGRRSPEAGAFRFLEWAMSRSDGRPSDMHRLDEEAVRHAAPAIVLELAHATGEREVGRRELARLDVDTHWLYGTASSPMARRLAHRAARRSRRIRPMEVCGAGHAIQLDAPDVVVGAVDGAPSAA